MNSISVDTYEPVTPVLEMDNPEHYFGNVAQIADCLYRLRNSVNLQKPDLRAQAMQRIENGCDDLLRSVSLHTTQEKEVIELFCTLAVSALTTTDENFKKLLDESIVAVDSIIRKKSSQPPIEM